MPILQDAAPLIYSTGKAYKVDVTSCEAVDEAVISVIQDFDGRLDIFVANSGISWGDEAFIDADISRYHNLMKTNTDGVVYCAHAAGKHFRRQKNEATTAHGAKLKNFTSGSFIATASMSGHIVNIPRRQAAYNASKAALIHLCKHILPLKNTPLDIIPTPSNTTRQIPCYRVAWICSRQQRLSRLLQHWYIGSGCRRHYGLNQGQNSHGVRCR